MTKRSFISKLLLMLFILAVLAASVVVIGYWLSERNIQTTEDQRTPVVEEETIRYTGQMSRAVESSYTSDKVLALTFNGLADLETMQSLLEALDEHQISATFFIPGMRMAEEPDIAQRILDAGHEIESNMLDQGSMSEHTYEEIYRDLKLTNEIFNREIGMQPQYVRSRSGDYTAELREAVNALGMQAVISNSINPRDRDMQSAQEIGAYVDRFMHRGAIVQLHTEFNPEIVKAVSYIAAAAERKGYRFVTLGELLANDGVRKRIEDIPGFDAAVKNDHIDSATYVMFDRLPTGQGHIALTFDDWGSDHTVNEILDILDHYDIKSTFFVTAKGVENNPNLARAIIEAGHEIANHTYSHQVVTTLTAEELQDEVIRAHRVITEAIQQQPTMLFRPPTGAIDERSAKIIAATGYETIAMFDVTALDWDVRNSAEDITNTVLEQTEDGSIILLHLHDGIHTIEALPGIIEQLLSQGYSFQKVTDMLKTAEKEGWTEHEQAS